MRKLDKDEKQYINNKIEKRVEAYLEKYDKKKLEESIRKDILSNVNVKNAIKFLETIFTEDEILKRSKFNYYINNGVFEFRTENISIKITVKLSPTIIKKINEFTDISRISHYLQDYCGSLNFEEYYILFGTWTAPNSERLNKINELIELICKDLNI